MLVFLFYMFLSSFAFCRHILTSVSSRFSFYVFFVRQIILCIYFLPARLDLLCYFHSSIALLFLLIFLYFFENKCSFFQKCFLFYIKTRKKNHNNPLFSFKSEFFIIFMGSFLLICQK